MCFCCNQHETDVPSAEQESIGIRLKLLYDKNKPLAITLILLAILLILGILFVIVYFGILHKGAATATTGPPGSATHAMSLQALHLRFYHA
jgi:hypothetical protein